MAIRLKVEDYCSDCDRFEADVRTTKLIGDHPIYGTTVVLDTEVLCCHAPDCARLYGYLCDQFRKEHTK